MPINPRPIRKNNDDDWTTVDLFADSDAGDRDVRDVRGMPKVSADDGDWTTVDLFARPEEPAGRTIGGTIKDIGVSVAKGVAGLGEAAVGLADIPTFGIVGKTMEEYLGYDPKKTQEFLSGFYSPEQKKAFGEVEQAVGFLGTIKESLKHPSTIGHAAVESFPLMLGGAAAARGLLAIGMKSPLLAGAIGEGIVSAGAAAEQTRQQTEDGLLTAKQALIPALSGAGTAMFSLVGGRVAQKLGLVDVDTFLAGGGNVTSAGVIKRIIGGGISEGAFEELPQSMQEQVWLNAALDKPLMEGVSEAGATGMLAGAAMGAGFNIFTGRVDEAPPTARDELLEDYEKDATAKEILTGKKEDKLARAEALEAEEAAAVFEEPPAKPKEEAIEDDKEKERRLARIEREREEPGRPIPEPVTGREEVEAGRVLQEAADETRKVNEQAQEAAASPLNDIQQPTEAQLESGNYKKGHIKVQGLDIAVENPDGSQRTGTDQDGETWSVTMAGHYGYFKRSEGKDGEQIDVFVNVDTRHETDNAYIVDQVDPKTGKFDEHKVMMGYPSVEEAEKGYLANYKKDWKGLGNITEVSVDDLKKFTEKRQTSPYSEIVKKVAPEIIEKEPIKFVGSRETAKGEFPIFEDKSGFQVDYKPAEHEISNIAEYETARPRFAKPPKPTPPEAVEKEIEAEPIPEVAPKLPTKPKPSKIRTLRGAIKELGGIDFLNYTGELKDLEPSIKRTISKKGAAGIDQAVDQLIADGWLDKDTTVASFLEDLRTNPESLLSRDRITADITTKKPHELSAEEKRLKAELEPEIEAPPEGDYITINAEDLPKGKELTLLEGKTTRGWDLYEVTAKDPFEITLMDGKEVKLSPLDKVQVLKKDVKDISAIEVIRPDGTYVDRNKTKTAEKDGLKAKYYGVYRKDGAFTAWKTKAEIDKIKKAEGKPALDLRQEYYGKQAKVAPTEKMKQRGLDLEIEDKKQPSLFEPKPIKAVVPKPTMQEKVTKPKVEKKQEPVKPTAITVPKRQPGFAWIKGKQKPILSARLIERGKDEGKYEVVLTKGRDADGNIIPGVKRIVEEKAIITMPEKVKLYEKPAKKEAEEKPGIKPPNFYKVIITAPDGRFGTEILEGGIDKRTAEYEAKKYRELGMVVKVMPEAKPPKEEKAFATKGEYPGIKVLKGIHKEKGVTYRGQSVSTDKYSENVQRTATYGYGLYSTKDINQAKEYGKVHTVYNGIPKNPLQFDDHEIAKNWVFKESDKLGYRRLSDFNKAYPDIAEYIASLGYDGVQVGTGKDAEYVLYPESVLRKHKIQYATKAVKPQDTTTRQDLQSIFGKMKNLRTGVNQAGNFYFKVEGRPAVEILEVDHISGFIQVQKGTDKERIAVGSYLKNTIELKTGGKGFTADINTAWHEFHHYLEKSGIVTTNDIKALDSAIGKAEVTEEDRATYVGDNLAAWKTQTNTRIKRILKKISDFANAVYEFFSRTRTARGVLREIETGRILRKEAPIPREQIVSPAYQQTAERFYSQVIKTVEDKMPAKMQASAVLPWLKKQPGIKPAELEWMGIEEILEGKKVVSKDELAGLLRENEVRVKEVAKGERTRAQADDLLAVRKIIYDRWDKKEIDRAERNRLLEQADIDFTTPGIQLGQEKFTQYQLPGEKENYRELLFTLPSDKILEEQYQIGLISKKEKVSKAFFSSHWPDEPNVFAHVRTNERTDADGNRVLFIEEIQSDWEQAIRKGEKVPDMPFKKNWHEVVLKRMIRQAAEQGFYKVAWITGKQTTDRYDLSKQVDSIEFIKQPNNKYAFNAMKDEGVVISKNGLTEQELIEHIGKDIAQKIVTSVKKEGSLSAIDLKVGGEWASHLYDKMIPQYLKKFGKKYGAKVSKTEVDTTGWMSKPKYIGENYTIEDVKKVLVVAKKSGRSIYESPITGKKQMFPVNRVQIDEESREIQREMASGVSFSEAISKQSNAIAEIFGGNIEKITDVANVHSFTITPELKRAALFEGMPLFQTKGPTYAETQEPVTEEDWIANRKVKKDIKLTLLTNVKRVASEIAEGADKYLGAISTRLGNVSPKLKNKLRQLDFDINTNHAEDVKAVEPLLRKAIKMEKNDIIDWDYARKNSAVDKINELVTKYGMQKEYAAYRDTLDNVREEGLDVGLDIGEIEEYAPRILKDQRGFLKAINKPEYRPLYTDRLKKRAADLDMTVEAMPLDMKADIISNIILGGWSGLGGVPATRQRVLKKIPPELNKFYMDSDAALMQHLYSMRKAIEARRFFGKIPKKVAEMRKRLYNTQTLIRALNSNLAGKLSKGQLKELARLEKSIKSGRLDEKQLAKARRTVKALKNIATDTMPDEQISTIKKNRSRYIGLEREYTAYIAKYGAQRDYTQNIGAYIIELIDKREIDAQHEGIVNDILNARFHEKGTRGIIQAYKNMSYIDTMGSPISALTQIGDFAWPMFEYGIPSTLKHAYRAAMKKSKITKEDVGVERIAQEFADSGTLGNAVSKVFKMVGLEKIDAIGKETLLNAALDSYQKQAKKNPAKLKKEIRVIFEAETDSVIEDLANNEISDNVKLLTYHKLLDFQPAGLSEMTQKYLSAGNGRLFYMLKTFTLKQFDIFRRISYNKIIKGDKAEKKEGLKNLVKMSMFFVLANAGADELKDWALGRKTDLDDRVVDNMLRLFGVSKFVTWKARTEGVGSALARQILPPFKFIDSAGKDIVTFGDEKGLEVIGSVPVAGKLAYWHMGRGLSKREDLWNRRLRKRKARLSKTKDNLDKAKDKMEFRRKYHSELLELKRINKLQGRLNKKRKRINELKSLAETVERKKQMQRLEVARTDMIKNFLGKE